MEPAETTSLFSRDLLDFIAMENGRLSKAYNYPEDKEIILAWTLKIMEEIGELSGEVLAHNAMQRKNKLDRHTNESMHEELADVVITALLLARVFGMDIEKALKAKMEKINKRHADMEYRGETNGRKT